MTESEERLYQIFADLDITEYQVHEHQAVFTSQEAKEAGLTMPGLNLKNLLVKDKKDGRFFLVILEEHRQMDGKHFKQITGWRQIRFAHAEELMEVLALSPGAVSPFGLIHDKEKQITVVLDKQIGLAAADVLVHFHPNRNTATVSLTKGDFMKFLAFTGHSVIFEEERKQLI